jgi:hypothetical protein
MLWIVVQLAILRQGMARGGSWVVISPWLWFWWVLIAAGSACLCRRCAEGNGARGRIISGQGRGRETFSDRVHGKHELSLAGVFPPRGKPAVVIADVPSPLAEHQGLTVRRRGRYASTRWARRPNGPDCNPFSIRGPTQTDQDRPFVSTGCVGPLEMP